MGEVSMQLEAVLGLPEGLEIISGDIADQVITLTVISTQQHPCCPLCGTSASRVHSHYCRQLTDMSCAGRYVRFLLHVRKCFCDEKTCARKIFTERLVPFIQPWARVTTRFFQAIEDIGLATSGMLGARKGAPAWYASFMDDHSAPNNGTSFGTRKTGRSTGNGRFLVPTRTNVWHNCRGFTNT